LSFEPVLGQDVDGVDTGPAGSQLTWPRLIDGTQHWVTNAHRSADAPVFDDCHESSLEDVIVSQQVRQTHVPVRA
jgi:hypothetical protein